MKKCFSGLKVLLLTMSCLAFLIAGIAGTGLAEDAQQSQSLKAKKPKAGSKMMGSGQKMRQMQKKSQNLRKELRKIRQKAMEDNPELKKEEKNLRSLVQKKVKENMANMDVDKKRMDQIRNKIRENPDMNSTRKKELIKEYQKNAQVYQKAQRKAMQDKKVKNTRDKFQKELKSAMKEVDPDTQSILKKLRNIRSKMRRLKTQNMQKMRKQQQ